MNMGSRFRLKLFITLLVFALIISISIATIDYFRLKERTIKDNKLQIEQATETVKYALKTIDKAYFYLDEETATRMAENTSLLQKKYEQNPQFYSWDFELLAKEMDMDIYILDEGNKIIHSNDPREVGLDFSVCCGSFNKLLNERRASGELFIDGIDVDQQTGKVKKFSYMATDDKKYMIELGYSLENEAIFQEFDFLKVTDELVEEFTLIEGIHVLNLGGLPFGTRKTESPPSERREAFERTRETNEVVEIDGEYKGKAVMFRYEPYQSAYDNGSTKVKVVEIIYNKNNLHVLLRESQKSYFIQLLIIFIVTIIISSVIANWLAKPVYLAYHDSLTGLKNRASFDRFLKSALAEKKETTALLMMDIDNFKLVNDYLGHGRGDYLLQLIAQTIKEAVGSDYETFRLGGDEFAVIMKNTTKKNAEQTAQIIIDTLKETLKVEKDIHTLSVSISVGIALSREIQSPKMLYKNADIALYESKEKGKNQYQIYQGGKAPKIPFID